MTRAYRRLRVMVSRWRTSADDAVGLGGEELVPGRPYRCGAGSMPAAGRICQTVDGAIG